MLKKVIDNINIPYGRCICYSGFRDGQHPGGIHPTYEQIKEDLEILHGNWQYLRLYDCDLHAERVIQVIEREQMDLKIMLGAYIEAQINNPDCPWGGGVYTDRQLKTNKTLNKQRIQNLIQWSFQYPEIIFAVSVGNEACVAWTDHLVPESAVIDFVNTVKSQISQPVTFCENYVPWATSLENLAATVDFISIHTYPVWEYKSIEEGLEYTKENYRLVAEKYPNKKVIITEAGWATHSNGRGIPPQNVHEEMQKIYFEQLMEWVDQEKILTFYFEAFDENWKGSSDPLEPEKHWGLYHTDRSPKLAANLCVQNNEVI